MARLVVRPSTLVTVETVSPSMDVPDPGAVTMDGHCQRSADLVEIIDRASGPAMRLAQTTRGLICGTNTSVLRAPALLAGPRAVARLSTLQMQVPPPVDTSAKRQR